MSSHIEDVAKASQHDAISTLPNVPIEYEDEKNFDDITAADDLKGSPPQVGGEMSRERRERLMQYYGQKAEDDNIAPARDVQMIMDRILEMSEEEAVHVLLGALEFHAIDPNFPSWTMAKLKFLVRGYKMCDLSEEDWAFDLKTEAAMLKYHSPYPEVRAVTDPFDDPETPVETFRAYILGLCFMAGSTALNTFFATRQPAITLSSIVMQLLLAPCGWTWAKIMPNWHIPVPFIKRRIALNPGPWQYKEQCFATILFTIVHGQGGAYGLFLVRESAREAPLIVEKLPMFFNMKWLNWGYMICLSLSMQAFGFGYAGLVRRLVIFPVNAIWPR